MSGGAARLELLKGRLRSLRLPRIHLMVMANRTVEAVFAHVKSLPSAVHQHDRHDASAMDVALMMGRNNFYLEALAAMGCEPYLDDASREALTPLYCYLGLPAMRLRGDDLNARRRMLQCVALNYRIDELAPSPEEVIAAAAAEKSTRRRTAEAMLQK